MGHMGAGAAADSARPAAFAGSGTLVVAVGSGRVAFAKDDRRGVLAVALGKLGYKVGLIDADIYGPNVPDDAGA